MYMEHQSMAEFDSQNIWKQDKITLNNRTKVLVHVRNYALNTNAKIAGPGVF